MMICQHKEKRYTGLMPCTGKQICLSCEAEIKRIVVTEKEYQASLERTVNVLIKKGYSI